MNCVNNILNRSHEWQRVNTPEQNTGQGFAILPLKINSVQIKLTTMFKSIRYSIVFLPLFLTLVAK